jgi:hypothetical protein
LPMFTGKIAVRNRKIGEFGLSCMTGVYNKWQEAGIVIDEKRSARAFAIDFSTAIFNNKIAITAEAVKTLIDVPAAAVESFGSQQFGVYLDLVGTVFQGQISAWTQAKINIGARFEYVDYNENTFKTTNELIGDEAWAIVPSFAFRPSGTTVLRLNYRYQSHRDFLNNPPSKTGAIQAGFSTYF